MKRNRLFKFLPPWRRGRSERRRSSETGFTLLEVVISMGVLVVASMTVATSTTSSFQAVDQSEINIRVEKAIQETMESIRAVPFDGLEALDGNQLNTNDKTKRILVTIQVSQVSTSLKAIEVEIFKKARNSAGQTVPGDKLFQALTYRSQR